MEKTTLNYSASGQKLKPLYSMKKFASDTVNYVEAVFDLDESWEFDSVRAIWKTDAACISTVLDQDGACTVPQEVLQKRAKVEVNLVGSDVEDDQLVDRLTTYPVQAFIVDRDVPICGTETVPITPSQFEQFIEAVASEVAKIKDISDVELNADYTLTFLFSDGTEWTTPIPIRGEQGAKGETGNGISDIEKIGSQGRIDTYRITYTNGGHFDFEVTNGEKGEQGETGNGIDRIEKTATVGSVDTYTIYFTDGSTTTFTITNGEVTMAQFEKAFPTDTASGSIASFPDGSDLFPMKSLKVSLEPVQDLSGYDEPWVGGAGKNKLQVTADTRTINGVTFAVNTDGTVMVNGTATADARFVVGAYRADGSALSANGCPSGGSASTYRMFFQYIGGDTGNGASATPASGSNVEAAIQIYSGYTANNLLFKPMIRASGTDSTFAPYSNICPISGWDSMGASVTGVNLFDGVLEQGTFTNAGAEAASNKRIRTGFIRVKQGDVSISTPTANTYIHEVYCYDKNKDFVRRLSGGIGASSGTVTVPNGVQYVRFSMRHADDSNIAPTAATTQLELGSTATDYEPYNGTTYTADLPQTVYGGWVDLATGEYNTKPYYASYNGETLTGEWISDRDKYVAGTSPTIGAQVVNIGADGTDGTITPQTIQTLQGTNNVWSDGDVEVEYKADVQLYIEKKLS